ncbi:ribonuclease H-like domain-containing protein [Tanacetum coccineum]
MGHMTQSGPTTLPHQPTIHSTQSTPSPNTVHQPTRTHPIVICAQVGTFKPNPHFHGHTSHISPLLKSLAIALSDSNWRDVMYDKYNALIKNSIRLVPLLMDVASSMDSSCTESKLGTDGDPVSDPTLYRSLAGDLQYLTFTRPDISYAVQHVCLYMHDSREPHFLALKICSWRSTSVAETAWLRNLLRELHMPLSSATLVYCDNVSAIYLTANPVQH